jgi:hypothetical protein
MGKEARGAKHTKIDTLGKAIRTFHNTNACIEAFKRAQAVVSSFFKHNDPHRDDLDEALEALHGLHSALRNDNSRSLSAHVDWIIEQLQEAYASGISNILKDRIKKTLELSS